MVSGYGTFRHIFTLHAQKRLFRSLRSKIWPRYSLRRPWFPERRVYFHYLMTFSAYIWCFVHNFIWPCALDFWPFDLGGVWRIKSLIRPTDVPILRILRLSVFELCMTQSDHTAITWNGHCACAVSRYLSPGGGVKMIHVFEIPDPNLSTHFFPFRELRRSYPLYVICEK